MPDGRDQVRLHSDDLDAIVRAMQAGPVRLPPPASDVPSGIDARVISEAVRAIVGERVANFLTRDQIGSLVDERLARIGLRMDEDHIEDTGDAIRGAMKWHRLASKTWMAAIGTIVLGAIYALARKAGLPVPTAP